MGSYTDTFTGNPVQASPINYRGFSFGANLALSWPIVNEDNANVAANIMQVTATTTSLQLAMPPANQVGNGQACDITNVGSNTFTVTDSNGNTIVSIIAGAVYRVYVSNNSIPYGADSWSTYAIGTGASAPAASALAGLGLKAITTTLNQDHPETNLTSNYQLVAADRAQTRNWTGGTGSITIDAVANLPNGWFTIVKNLGSGTLTITPTSPNTIDGVASITLNPLDSCFICSNGSLFFTIGLGRNVVATDSRLALSVAGSTNVTLTTAQAANDIFDFTGTLTGNIQVIFPTTVKNYFVTNATSGLFSLTCITALGTGVAIPQGSSTLITCDGTNVIDASPQNAGTISLSVAGSSNVTLTASQAGYIVYNLTGLLTGNINLTFPAVSAYYIINNNTTGAFSVTLKVTGGISALVAPQASTIAIYVDGSVPSLAGFGTQYVFQCGPITGTANALVAATTFPSNFTLNIGTLITFTPAMPNTTSATLNVAGSGAITCQKLTPGGAVNLTQGDLIPAPLLAQYNGTNWFIISDVFNATASAVSGAQAIGINNTFTPFVCTAATTFTVAQSTTLPVFWYVDINAFGGAATITPNAADSINVKGATLSAGTSFVIPQGENCRLYTNGAGSLYINFLGPRLALESTLASNTTTDLGTSSSNVISITGTTAITSLGSSAYAQNPLYFLRFTGALTLTQNGTSLILPGSANITTAAGDSAIAKYEGSGNWRIISYTKASGLPIANSFAGKVITGFLPTSISSSSNTSCTITYTSGSCVDGTNSAIISGGSYAWSVANGNAINGYSGGTTLPNSDTIHFYVCSGTSGTGVYAVPSASYPLGAGSAPTGYQSFVRRIWSAKTNSSGVLIGDLGSGGTAVESLGGGITFFSTTDALGINSTNGVSTSRTLFTLPLPINIKVEVHGRLAPNTGSGIAMILCSPDAPDIAPNATAAWSVAPGWDAWSSDPPANSTRILITNTSAQLAARASGTSNCFFVIEAWTDYRRD